MDIEQLKTGYILCEHGSTWLAKSIQFVSNSIYNHCATIVIEDGQYYIYEASLRYKVSKLEDRLKKETSYLIKIPKYNYSEDLVIRECKLLIGRLYDIKGTFIQQLWWYITKYLTNKPKWILQNNDNHFYCSEAVIHVLNKASTIKIDDDKSPQWIANNNELFKSKILKF